MISVVLLGSGPANGQACTSGAAVRSLAALVSGAVEGVIRDVQLLAPTAAPDLAKVAEHAGCAYAAGDLTVLVPRAVADARSGSVLLLAAGTSFDRAVTDEMADVVTRHGDWLAGGMALKSVGTGPLGRMLPRFAATVGVLAARDRLAGVAAATMPAVWRAVRPRRSFTTRAWTGG